MADKEKVGQPKLCKVLSIFDRFYQYFFILYISEVMDFDYAKQIIYKKPLDMCLKTIRYIVSRYSKFSQFK